MSIFARGCILAGWFVLLIGLLVGAMEIFNTATTVGGKLVMTGIVGMLIGVIILFCLSLQWLDALVGKMEHDDTQGSSTNSRS